MSEHSFDPLKHKRGAHGKFTDMLRELRPGSAVKLPDGVHIKVTHERHGEARRRMYQVHDANGKKVGGRHLEAGSAAMLALNTSAQHTHPDAVGGNKRYENFNHAMGEGQGAAEAAGSVHVQGNRNIDQLRQAYPADARAAIAKVKAEQRRGILPNFQANELMRRLRAEQAQEKRMARQPKAEDAKSGFYIKQEELGGFGNYQEGYRKEKRFVVYGPDRPGGTVFKSRNEATAHLKMRQDRHKMAQKARAAAPAAGGGGDRAGRADKPKAEDLKLGQTIHHEQHGEMIYMGRNATNHHVARKKNEPEGTKPRIIRLKNVYVGQPPDRGEQQSMDIGKPEDTPQQKAILKQHAVSRKVRSMYPAGTRVEATSGAGGEGRGHFGTVVRHVPGMNAQGGHLTVKWDNGREGRISPGSVRLAAEKKPADDIMKQRQARYKELAKLPRNELNAKAKQADRMMDVNNPKATVITAILDAELPLPKDKAGARKPDEPAKPGKLSPTKEGAAKGLKAGDAVRVYGKYDGEHQGFDENGNHVVKFQMANGREDTRPFSDQAVANDVTRKRTEKVAAVNDQGGQAKAKPAKMEQIKEGPLLRSGSDMYDVKRVYKLPDGRIVRQEKEYEPIMEGRLRAGKRTFGTFWYVYPSEAEAGKGSRGQRKQFYSREDAINEQHFAKDKAKRAAKAGLPGVAKGQKLSRNEVLAAAKQLPPDGKLELNNGHHIHRAPDGKSYSAVSQTGGNHGVPLEAAVDHAHMNGGLDGDKVKQYGIKEDTPDYIKRFIVNHKPAEGMNVPGAKAVFVDNQQDPRAEDPDYGIFVYVVLDDGSVVHEEVKNRWKVEDEVRQLVKAHGRGA